MKKATYTIEKAKGGNAYQLLWVAHMGNIHVMNYDSQLPVFRYYQCLQCGQKTLVYPNGLCRRCILMLRIQWIVAAAKNRHP